MVTADLLRRRSRQDVRRQHSADAAGDQEAHSFISRDVPDDASPLHAAQCHASRPQTLAGNGLRQPAARALPPEIFELCNTRIVHTLRSMHNLEALMATTGDVSRELWSRCPLLGQGQAVLSSPQLNRSVILSVRPAASRRRFVR